MTQKTYELKASLSSRSVLLIGLGGLGCPAAWALAQAGVGTLILVDDDEVELSNLHRQILYDERDIGQHKLDAAQARLAQQFPSCEVQVVKDRFLPENAMALAERADLVVEGADNFATKFLTADACFLARRPVVHGAAIRWTTTAWSVSPRGAPCYRCLFEDLPPREASQNCAEAGVVGPVAGIGAALMTNLAVGWLAAQAPVGGRDRSEKPTQQPGALWTYDGKSDKLRQVNVAPRQDCPLCGDRRKIDAIVHDRYLAAGYVM